MLSTSRCAHCLNTGGLFTSLCVTVLPLSPALPSPSVFILAENCAGLFQHIFPLSRWKPVSSGEDYVVKYVSFWYKAPKPHTSERGALIRKIVSSTLPHLTTRLPLNTLCPSFSPCYLPTILTQSKFPAVNFLFDTILISSGGDEMGASQSHFDLWLEIKPGRKTNKQLPNSFNKKKDFFRKPA